MDVDAREPGSFERARQLRHQEGVGGEGEVADAVDSGDALDNFEQIERAGWARRRSDEICESQC